MSMEFNFKLSVDEVVTLEMALSEYKNVTLKRQERSNNDEHYERILTAIQSLQEKLK